MIEYHFTYFSLRGRGEFIRYIFHHAGVAFNDKRVDLKTEWSGIKKDAPMGQLPVLELNDGRVLCQSLAIARYLATQFGLEGANSFESAQMEMLAGGLEDFFQTKMKPVVVAHMTGKPDEKKTKYDEIKGDDRKKFLSFYEKFLKDNGGVWMVGSKVSWVDFLIAEQFDRYSTFMDTGFLAEFQTLKDYVKRVHALPNIAKYVAERPETRF